MRADDLRWMNKEKKDMKCNEPDWYIPRDWRFILTFHLIFLGVVIVTAMFLPALSQARKGEPIVNSE